MRPRRQQRWSGRRATGRRVAYFGGWGAGPAGATAGANAGVTATVASVPLNSIVGNGRLGSDDRLYAYVLRNAYQAATLGRSSADPAADLQEAHRLAVGWLEQYPRIPS